MMGCGTETGGEIEESECRYDVEFSVIPLRYMSETPTMRLNVANLHAISGCVLVIRLVSMLGVCDGAEGGLGRSERTPKGASRREGELGRW